MARTRLTPGFERHMAHSPIEYGEVGEVIIDDGTTHLPIKVKSLVSDKVVLREPAIDPFPPPGRLLRKLAGSRCFVLMFRLVAIMSGHEGGLFPRSRAGIS